MKKKSVGLGEATGKIILMGEHSVVYGKPAIALPFPATNIKVTITQGIGKSLLECDFYSGLLETMPELLESLKNTIKITLKGLGKQTSSLNIKIDSTIPAERGMGSSAAVSVATVRALYDFFDCQLTQSKLLEIVHLSEKIAHGNPSGLDSLMTSSVTPYYYIKEQQPIPISLQLDAVLVVADTGITGQTKQAVASIGKKITSNDKEIYLAKINHLGVLAEETRTLLENNQAEEIGHRMTDAQLTLTELGVSNSELNSLVATSLEHGALGAKLTGGGRGGCMIALAKTTGIAKEIELSLKNAGAKQTWLYEMSVKNV